MKPEYFFYYSSLEGNERKDWIEKLLSEKQIYFRSKQDLGDDINELRPKFEIGGDEDSQRNYIKRLAEPLVNGLSPAKKLLTRKNLKRQFTARSGLAKQKLRETLDRIGVLSLSATISSHILWGRYADAYRGIAIEFDSDKGLFALAQIVNYESTLPVVRMLDHDELFLQKAVRTKLKDWVSQQEWRVIAKASHSLAEHDASEFEHSRDVEPFILASHGPGYYAIPEDSIKSIIMGPKISEPDRELLQTLTKRLGLKHLLIQAVHNYDGSISKPGRVDQA